MVQGRLSDLSFMLDLVILRLVLKLNLCKFFVKLSNHLDFEQPIKGYILFSVAIYPMMTFSDYCFCNQKLF